jgi:hypothetical protein
MDVDAKEADIDITSFFKPPKAWLWEVIRHRQRHYRDGVVAASREALKVEAAARLARLRQKKQDYISLCAARCDKYNEFIKIKPLSPARRLRETRKRRRGAARLDAVARLRLQDQ